MPEINPLVFLDIEKKQDSVEKLAAVVGKPTKEHLFAGEINLIVKKINQLKQLLDAVYSYAWLDGNNQIIPIGEIGELPVHIVVRSLEPPQSIQADYLRIFRATRSGVEHNYLYSGQGGLVGVGQHQPNADDFYAISGNILANGGEILVTDPTQQPNEITTVLQVALNNLYASLNQPTFSTQEILSGGNYNNLEVTADLLVFKNENAQAILNGIWGRKEFHILNLSTSYEVRINHNSPSVSGSGKPIMLPTANGKMGIKGTARILHTDGYGYFVADTWGSKYRPEFKGLTKPHVVTVDEESNAGAMEMTEFMVFRDAQAAPMSKAELNLAYPDAKRPFQVVCNQLNLIYLKSDNNDNNWKSFPLTTIS